MTWFWVGKMVCFDMMMRWIGMGLSLTSISNVLYSVCVCERERDRERERLLSCFAQGVHEKGN